MNRFRQWAPRVFGRFFHDTASLVELFSSLCLLGWSLFVGFNAEILSRDSYQSFGLLPAGAWVSLFALTGLAQVSAAVSDHARHYDWRALVMAFAAGLWFVVSLSFVFGPVLTTAAIMYPAITLICILSTLWLAWKSSPDI
ncbi:MAG: hypothetical protein AAF739_03255 [Pseudomonadota bacterium]